MATQDRIAPQPAGQDALSGVVIAFSAFLIWGFMPLLLKAVAHIPATEVVAHRVVWSVPVAGAILLALGRTADIRAALRTPRTLMMAAVTASLISINWGLYVWAIAVERTVETALGYYINPLVNVLFGAVLLGERFTRAQLIAIGLATLGVGVMTVAAGGLPWISLVLAFSFASYGYLRKTLPIGPSQGFFLEASILGVPALIYILLLEAGGAGHLTGGGPDDPWLLLLCGPATAVPLILYAFGAKLLRYSTLGLMQYVAPTLIFLIAVFVFDEPFSGWQLVGFLFIWVALAVYSWSMVRGRGA